MKIKKSKVGNFHYIGKSVLPNTCHSEHLSVQTPVIPNMSAKNVGSNISENFAGNKIRISLHDFHPGPTRRVSKGRHSRPICEYVKMIGF